MHFNYRTIFRVIALLLLITGTAMVFPLICALYYGEMDDARALGISMGLSLVLGAAGYFGIRGPKSPYFGENGERALKTRDCYLLVMLAWLSCSLLGSLPYLLSGQVGSFVDGLFESVAGYTTTGASIMANESFSSPMILWKAITHWLGGMGILVFMIILLPALGVGGQKIAVVETPGPDLTKLAPRAQDIAKLLYFIYISLSLIEFLLLWLSPKMNVFDALITTMGSISTSGLALHPEGIGYYDSVYIEGVVALFMFLSAINFIFFISILKRDLDNLKKTLEIRIYLLIVFLSTLIITLALVLGDRYETLWGSVRHALFQVISFASTTGYILDDYVNWPSVCHLVFFFLLLVGGCGSCTAGGLKIIRFQIIVKAVLRSFRKKLHPNLISPIRSGGDVISNTVTASISSFFILYLLTYAISALVISLDNMDLETTFSAALSLMSTTGIYFGSAGAEGTFDLFSQPIRLFMCLLMVVGRLELYTIFFLFFPSFWNPDRAATR